MDNRVKPNWEMSFEEFRIKNYSYYLAIKDRMNKTLLKFGYTQEQVVNPKSVEDLIRDDYLKLQKVKHLLKS